MERVQMSQQDQKIQALSRFFLLAWDYRFEGL
jgi:hypothetical protein